MVLIQNRGSLRTANPSDARGRVRSSAKCSRSVVLAAKTVRRGCANPAPESWRKSTSPFRYPLLVVIITLPSAVPRTTMSCCHCTHCSKPVVARRQVGSSDRGTSEDIIRIASPWSFTRKMLPCRRLQQVLGSALLRCGTRQHPASEPNQFSTITD